MLWQCGILLFCRVMFWQMQVDNSIIQTAVCCRLTRLMRWMTSSWLVSRMNLFARLHLRYLAS